MAYSSDRTPYRIGYTLWPATFDLSDPAPWLDEAAGVGVDSVEVPLFCTRLIAAGRLIEPAMRRFTAPFERCGLDRTCHAMLTINLMDAPDMLVRHEAVARANIEVAARLGAPRMVLHCGLSDARDERALEAAYARQRDSLARLGDVAAEHGVEICVETIWSFDGRETALPSRLAREIAAVGHDAVRATLDFAHASLQCQRHGADLMAEIHALAPLTHHLHLNDCFGVKLDMPIALPAEEVAYGSGDTHLPIGWGALDWERMLTEPAWPDAGLVLNQELHPTFWHALPDDVAEMRRLAGLMARRNAGPQAGA
ncbi:MAG: sugar phosphate isomerase/epimerase family protein [Thermohalobaculum sp.]|nr:sugar phosphate isomerase/epimerase family protein [Thermohalobaculum sp.]